MSKRKAGTHRYDRARDREAARPSEPDPALFIQAHEADIVRGPRAHAAALALEARTVGGKVVAGEGLIRWNAGLEAPRGDIGEDEEKTQQDMDDGDTVWVDRYAYSSMYIVLRWHE